MSITSITAEKITPLKNIVFVSDMESGPQITKGGLIIPDDNMSERGIHPRWGKVYAIGSEVTDIDVGDWVLIQHGRWTLGIDFDFEGKKTRLWRIEYPDAILLVSDSKTDPRLHDKHQF